METCRSPPLVAVEEIDRVGLPCKPAWFSTLSVAGFPGTWFAENSTCESDGLLTALGVLLRRARICAGCDLATSFMYADSFLLRVVPGMPSDPALSSVGTPSPRPLALSSCIGSFPGRADLSALVRKCNAALTIGIAAAVAAAFASAARVFGSACPSFGTSPFMYFSWYPGSRLATPDR